MERKLEVQKLTTILEKRYNIHVGLFQTGDNKSVCIVIYVHIRHVRALQFLLLGLLLRSQAVETIQRRACDDPDSLLKILFSEF
jgi:hypothetical protein